MLKHSKRLARLALIAVGAVLTLAAAATPAAAVVHDMLPKP